MNTGYDEQRAEYARPRAEYEIKFFDKGGQALETKEGTTYTFFADSLDAAHDHTWGLFALALDVHSLVRDMDLSASARRRYTALLMSTAFYAQTDPDKYARVFPRSRVCMMEDVVLETRKGYRSRSAQFRRLGTSRWREVRA